MAKAQKHNNLQKKCQKKKAGSDLAQYFYSGRKEIGELAKKHHLLQPSVAVTTYEVMLDRYRYPVKKTSATNSKPRSSFAKMMKSNQDTEQQAIAAKQKAKDAAKGVGGWACSQESRDLMLGFKHYGEAHALETLYTEEEKELIGGFNQRTGEVRMIPVDLHKYNPGKVDEYQPQLLSHEDTDPCWRQDHSWIVHHDGKCPPQHQPRNIFDGDKDTFWAASFAMPGERLTLTMDFRYKRCIDRLRIYSKPSNKYTLKHFRIEVAEEEGGPWQVYEKYEYKNQGTPMGIVELARMDNFGDKSEVRWKLEREARKSDWEEYEIHKMKTRFLRVVVEGSMTKHSFPSYIQHLSFHLDRPEVTLRKLAQLPRVDIDLRKKSLKQLKKPKIMIKGSGFSPLLIDNLVELFVLEQKVVKTKIERNQYGHILNADELEKDIPPELKYSKKIDRYTEAPVPPPTGKVVHSSNTCLVIELEGLEPEHIGFLGAKVTVNGIPDRTPFGTLCATVYEEVRYNDGGYEYVVDRVKTPNQIIDAMRRMPEEAHLQYYGCRKIAGMAEFVLYTPEELNTLFPDGEILQEVNDERLEATVQVLVQVMQLYAPKKAMNLVAWAILAMCQIAEHHSGRMLLSEQFAVDLVCDAMNEMITPVEMEVMVEDTSDTGHGRHRHGSEQTLTAMQLAQLPPKMKPEKQMHIPAKAKWLAQNGIQFISTMCWEKQFRKETAARGVMAVIHAMEECYDESAMDVSQDVLVQTWGCKALVMMCSMCKEGWEQATECGADHFVERGVALDTAHVELQAWGEKAKAAVGFEGWKARQLMRELKLNDALNDPRRKAGAFEKQLKRDLGNGAHSTIQRGAAYLKTSPKQSSSSNQQNGDDGRDQQQQEEEEGEKGPPSRGRGAGQQSKRNGRHQRPETPTRGFAFQFKQKKKPGPKLEPTLPMKKRYDPNGDAAAWQWDPSSKGPKKKEPIGGTFKDPRALDTRGRDCW
jgi:hypothetical protein